VDIRSTLHVLDGEYRRPSAVVLRDSSPDAQPSDYPYVHDGPSVHRFDPRGVLRSRFMASVLYSWANGEIHRERFQSGTDLG
jgi:hypothetical protein